MSRTYFAYILASKPRGTLYVGVTNSILTRIKQHRTGIGSAFTKRYRIHKPKQPDPPRCALDPRHEAEDDTGGATIGSTR